MKEKISLFNIKKIDDWVIFSGLVFIILPILIFLLSFTRFYYFIIGLILLGALIYKIMKCASEKSNGFENSELLSPESKKFFLLASIALFIWLYFSGIGNYAYQNWDFWVRNPIYNDLCSKSWPVYYDLSQQDYEVTSLIGGGWVAFSYYFAYWLTPAAICKLLHLSSGGCQFVLFIYTFIGLEIAHYLLLRLYRKFSWKITAIFILFSGMDVIERLINMKEFPAIGDDIEWSLQYFQCSANLTQLYYVFNQSIPIWILLLLLLNIDSPSVMAGLSSICFVYSPWATIGLIPIAVIATFYNRGDSIKSRIKSAVTPYNVLVPVYILLIFGLYYSASGGASGSRGFFGKAMGCETGRYIFLFIVYVLTEFGLFYLAIWKDILKYRYAIIIFIELTLYPIYYIVDFNFFIRGTIPALLILMTIVIGFMIDVIPEGLSTKYSDLSNMARAAKKSDSSKNTNINADRNLVLRKRILTVLLCIGAFTPLFTFHRSVIRTSYDDNFTWTTIMTFDDMSGVDEYFVTTANNQFFVHEFSAKPFYRYISKIGF